MQGPPYSPDISPIEHLWFLLKDAVYKINPDIENFGGDGENVRKALFKALFKTYDDIDEHYLHILVWSMKKRVRERIAAEGWYTEY